jgi:hypothetical protein
VLAGLSTPAGLLIDRYHRGAIVMVGVSMFAIPEPAIVLIERARDSTARFEVSADAEDLVAALVSRGLLVRDDP